MSLEESIKELTTKIAGLTEAMESIGTEKLVQGALPFPSETQPEPEPEPEKKKKPAKKVSRKKKKAVSSPEKEEVIQIEAEPVITKTDLIAVVKKNITLLGNDDFAREIFYKYQDNAVFSDLEEKHYAGIYAEIEAKNNE